MVAGCHETGGWPSELVVKLMPGEPASLVIDGEHPDVVLSFRLGDGTETHPTPPTDTTAERTAWALSAPDVERLSGATDVAFREHGVTRLAGQVWWGDRWQGWGCGTDGAVRLVSGPRGESGPPPTITWDGTTIVVDGEPGPDLQGPPGAPGQDVSLSDADPQPLANAAAPGASGEASRADHAHPLPSSGAANSTKVLLGSGTWGDVPGMGDVSAALDAILNGVTP